VLLAFYNDFLISSVVKFGGIATGSIALHVTFKLRTHFKSLPNFFFNLCPTKIRRMVDEFVLQVRLLPLSSLFDVSFLSCILSTCHI